MKKEKKIGAYLTIAAGALALIACLLYITAMYKSIIVFVCLILAIVISVAAFLGVHRKLVILAPALVAFLMAGATICSVGPMVNQLGYVVAKLDDISTVLTYIIAAVLMAVGMILAIVSSFMAQDVSEISPKPAEGEASVEA